MHSNFLDTKIEQTCPFIFLSDRGNKQALVSIHRTYSDNNKYNTHL